MGVSFLYQKSDLSNLDQILTEKPDIIYLGNSRFLSGIIPEVVRRETGLSGYNASADGGGIVFAKGFESVIMSYYCPKVFVIQIMPLDSERGSLNRLAPYFNNSEVRNLLSYYPCNIRLKYALFKTSRYNSMLQSIIKRLFVKFGSRHGYRPQFGSQSVMKPGKTIPPQKTGLTVQSEEIILRNFIEKAINSNIDVIIVKMPTLKQEKNNYYDVYSNFAKIYNIPLIDLSEKDDGHTQWTKEYFWNNGHLNNKGATVFSSLLGKEINKFIKNGKNSTFD